MNVRELVEKLIKAPPDALVGLQDQEGIVGDMNIVATTLPVDRSRAAYAWINEYGNEPKERVVIITPFAPPGDNPEEL